MYIYANSVVPDMGANARRQRARIHVNIYILIFFTSEFIWTLHIE